MNDIFTGLLPDTPEQRAERMSQAVSMGAVCFASDVPETRLSRIPSWMRRDDQGQRNSCAAHDGSNCAEKINYVKTGKPTQFSRQFLYIEGQKAGGMRVADAGCTLYGITKCLKTVGVCREELEPYGAWKTKFAPESYADASNYKLTNTVSVARGYADWRVVLGGNIGAILAASMWPIEIDSQGYARRYRPRGGGGHAYAGLFLADTVDANGRPDVWFLNSHQGNFEFRASATFVDDLMAQDQFGILGYTDMEVPEPRQIRWTEHEVIG